MNPQDFGPVDPHRARTSAPTGPRVRHPHPFVESTLSILSALGLVILSILALAALLCALWTVLSLAHAAAQARGEGEHPVRLWAIALCVSLGVPVALATWKHHAEPRRIGLAALWLVLVCNAAGLLAASQLIPDVVGSALRGHAAWIPAKRLGDSHSATRVLSALGHQVAGLVSPIIPTAVREMSQSSAPQLPPDDLQIAVDQPIRVPFADERNVIFMDVTLEGPRGRKTLPYLFDTGASFTTLSSRTAAELGIEVPEDAPTLKFNTASGPRESRMVYLPALALKDVRIEGILVSVCDACVNDRTEGLLGLNVIREFHVQMDYKRGDVVLLPRLHRDRPNRAYDIEPVVELEVEGKPEVWLGRIHWMVRVHNRSTQAIEGVRPLVKFQDGPPLVGEAIDRIAPGAFGRSLVEGEVEIDSRGGANGLFTLPLREAYW